MEIREMNLSDYEVVFGLWQSIKTLGMRSLDDSKEGIDRFLKRNPNTCLVATIETKIVGVILGGHDGRRGYIYHMSVAESFRNQGIGKALVTAVLEAFTKEDINKVALVAFSYNESGNNFWEAMGFSKREDLIYRNKSLNALNL